MFWTGVNNSDCVIHPVRFNRTLKSRNELTGCYWTERDSHWRRRGWGGWRRGSMKERVLNSDVAWQLVTRKTWRCLATDMKAVTAFGSWHESRDGDWHLTWKSEVTFRCSLKIKTWRLTQHTHWTCSGAYWHTPGCTWEHAFFYDPATNWDLSAKRFHLLNGNLFIYRRNYFLFCVCEHNWRDSVQMNWVMYIWMKV